MMISPLRILALDSDVCPTLVTYTRSSALHLHVSENLNPGQDRTHRGAKRRPRPRRSGRVLARAVCLGPSRPSH